MYKDFKLGPKKHSKDSVLALLQKTKDQKGNKDCTQIKQKSRNSNPDLSTNETREVDKTLDETFNRDASYPNKINPNETKETEGSMEESLNVKSLNDSSNNEPVSPQQISLLGRQLSVL